MVEYSPNQLDRIEQKLDRILKRFEDATQVATPLVHLREGNHELTPSDEELRKRASANQR